MSKVISSGVHMVVVVDVSMLVVVVVVGTGHPVDKKATIHSIKTAVKNLQFFFIVVLLSLQ
jgi:hypothetical protein